MKKIKKALSLLLVCIAIFSLAGCSNGGNNNENKLPSSKEIDTARLVTITYNAIPDSLNPWALSMEVPSGINTAQIYDTVLHKDYSGDILAGLAEKWDISEDGKTITLNIRQGLNWSTGDPFTAEDVAFSLNTYAANGSFASAYVDFDKAEATDEYTCVITLKEANVVFISYLTSSITAAIMSKSAHEKWGDEYGTSIDKVACIGPYIVTAWQPDVSMTYEANEDYWQGSPEIKNLEFTEIKDANATTVAMQTGELDVDFSPISGTAYDTLIKEDHIKTEEYLSERNEQIYFNFKNGPFTDVRMRQAVAHAVNAEDALAIGADGLGQTIRYPGDIGESITANPDYQPATTYEYNIEKAKDLVKECGMEGKEVVINSYNTDPYATLSTWLQSVLSEIGLDAKVQTMERAAFLDGLTLSEHDIFVLSWVGQVYDLDEVLGGPMFTSETGNTGNYGTYSNPVSDELSTKARQENDNEARKGIYQELIDLYVDEVVTIPLYATKSVIPHTSQLTTDNPHSYSMYDYKWVK